MKLSPEAIVIAQDITDIFDKFEVPLGSRDYMKYPVVRAYFIGLTNQNIDIKPADELTNEVCLQLAKLFQNQNLLY